MRTILFGAIGAAWLFAACNDDRLFMRKQIENWESRLASEPAAIDTLADFYQKYIVRYPDDGFTPQMLLKAAENQLKRGKMYDAADLLEKGIKNYPDNEHLPEMLALAGEIYEQNIGDTGKAEHFFARYRKEFPQGKDIAKADFFFKADDEKSRVKIDQLDSLMDDPKQRNGLNSQAVEQFIDACAQYARQYKDDYTAIYCDKAAKMAMAAGESLCAVEFWTYIYEKYPQYPYRADVLFFLGNEYETGLRFYARRPRTQWKKTGLFEETRTAEFMVADPLKTAAFFYKKLLADYPQDKMAVSAQNALLHLGKDANTVVAGFGENK